MDYFGKKISLLIILPSLGVAQVEKSLNGDIDGRWSLVLMSNCFKGKYLINGKSHKGEPYEK